MATPTFDTESCGVWGYWCTEGTGSSTTIWNNWVEDTATTYTTATTNNVVWRNWVTTFETTAETAKVAAESLNKGIQTWKKFNEGQKKKDEELRKKYEEEEKERERLRQIAKDKAKLLLYDFLGEKEAEAFKKSGTLLIHGKQFDWVIDAERGTPSIIRVERGKVVPISGRRMCIFPSGGKAIPAEDRVIAFALHCMANEEEFNKTANPQEEVHINENLRIEEAAVINS